jgi:hypothetical protein
VDKPFRVILDRLKKRSIGGKMKYFGALVLSLALAGSAFGAPACTSISSYAGLLAAEQGCEIGDKLFTDFLFGFGETGGASEVTAEDIGLHIVNQGDAAIGFDFINIPLFAGVGQTATISLGFNVTTLSGAPIITSNFLGFAAGTTGTGLATVKETFCVGGVRPCAAGGTSQSLQVAISPFATTVTDKKQFTGVTTIGVTKDIFVAGGTAGTGTISVVTNTVDQNGPGGDDTIPEPGTYALLGSGLVGLAFYGRRKV